jgi:signal transduction histidine kinase
MNEPPRRWVFPLWPRPSDGVWLVVAVVLFGALDVAVYAGVNPPTTGWAGPHAALALQLSVDVSLLFLARFPTAVGCWVLAVASVMAVADGLVPGLVTSGGPAAHASVPFATPAIIISLVRLLDRRRALVLVGLLAVLGSRFWAPDWAVSPFGLLNTVVPALGVLYLDARRKLVASLRERAERAEREQRLLAEQARAEERRRLAEEMHDVVTHRLSLMVLHAGALGTISTDPTVRSSAEDIRQAGTQALNELRELVGVLREGDAATSGATTEPAVPDPATLVEEARRVGEHIEYTAHGDPEPISATVRRTVFRVVQESLTNARKHAPGAAVTVTLTYRGDGVAVRIGNGPARRSADPVLAGSGSGAGLLGLGQRVELVGGTLRADPRPDGGFDVDAILPAYVPTRGDALHDQGDRRR